MLKHLGALWGQCVPRASAKGKVPVKPYALDESENVDAILTLKIISKNLGRYLSRAALQPL